MFKTNALINLINNEIRASNNEFLLALWGGRKRHFRALFLQQSICTKQIYTSLNLTISHLAAIKGDIDLLLFLQKMDEEFTSPDAKGFLPCHHAAAHLRNELNYFFSSHEHELVRGTSGLTPAAIRSLISRPNSKVITQNYWDFDALYFSICANQGELAPFIELESKPIKVQIDKLDRVGFDVKTLQPIQENAVVCAYDGRVTLGRTPFSVYAHGKFFQTTQGELTVDGSKWRSLGCMLNDSTPNIYKNILIDPRNGLPRIVFRALRPIEQDESLTWNYGPTHLVKHLPRKELQVYFLKKCLINFWHKADSKEFKNTLLQENCVENIQARHEIEISWYLDCTLHTLVELAAKGNLQAIHLKWFAAVSKKHPKHEPTGFCRIVYEWLLNCSEAEKKYISKRAEKLTSLELVHLLTRKKSRCKEIVHRISLKTIRFIASLAEKASFRSIF